MEDKFAELRATLDKIEAIDKRKSNLLEYRDRQLAELRDAGATWVKLQEFAGLSPRGLKLALDRARAAEETKPS